MPVDDDVLPDVAVDRITDSELPRARRDAFVELAEDDGAARDDQLGRERGRSGKGRQPIARAAKVLMVGSVCSADLNVSVVGLSTLGTVFLPVALAAASGGC